MTWRTLDDFTERSEPGRERDVVARVRAAVADLPMTQDELDRLGTAVSETVMNAIEHGNHNEPTLPVDVTVRSDGTCVEVLVSDNGGLRELPGDPQIPDLDAKLAGLQTPRGWGLFLIRSMVDEMDVVPDPEDETRHTARLLLRLADATPQEEDQHAQRM